MRRVFFFFRHKNKNSHAAASVIPSDLMLNETGVSYTEHSDGFNHFPGCTLIKTVEVCPIFIPSGQTHVKTCLFISFLRDEKNQLGNTRRQQRDSPVTATPFTATLRGYTGKNRRIMKVWVTQIPNTRVAGGTHEPST